MLKAAIKPNREYAMRERNTPDATVQHVRVIAHIRASKWKVEWIDPNSGLVDYVTSAQLFAPWSEHKSFLKEEANERRLREYNRELGYEDDDAPIPSALDDVFGSVGDDLMFYKGILSGSRDALNRFCTRAQVPAVNVNMPGYVDRQGKIRLPLDIAVTLAQQFCAAEPSTVLVGIDAIEQEWTRNVSRGEKHLVGLLQQARAAWALVRQWAGHDAAVAQREAEIQRLERLVWDAHYALQKAGLEKEAARLRRAIEK